MESLNLSNFKIEKWLRMLDDEAQDVETIASQIKKNIKEEIEFTYAANFLFEKAAKNPRIAENCAKLVNALAGVTVNHNKNPSEQKVFRDCIEQTALHELESDEFNAIGFIALLNQEKIFSAKFVSLISSTENEYKTKMKFPITLQLIEIDKKSINSEKKTVSGHLAPHLRTKKRPHPVYVSFELYINKIEKGNDDSSFDFQSFKNCSGKDVINCVRLLFDRIKSQKNPLKIQSYSKVILKVQRFALQRYSFHTGKNFLQMLLEMFKKTIKSFNNSVKWDEMINIGLMLSELYNINLVKNGPLFFWMNHVNRLALNKVEPAVEAMLITLKICSVKMMERDKLSFVYKYAETVKIISQDNETSSNNKQKAEEILSVLKSSQVKVSVHKQVKKDFKTEDIDDSLRHFQLQLNKIWSGSATSFDLDNYNSSDRDLQQYATIFFNTALENSDDLTLLLTFIWDTKHFNEFQKKLVNVCQKKFKEQTANGSVSLPLIKLIAALYNADFLTEITIALILLELTPPHFNDSRQLLLSLISDKVLKMRGKLTAAKRSLIELVKEDQTNFTSTSETKTKLTAASETISEPIMKEPQKKLNEKKESYDPMNNFHQALEMLTEEPNSFQQFPRIDDLRILEISAKILIQKALQTPSMACSYAALYCWLPSNKLPQFDVQNIIATLTMDELRKNVCDLDKSTVLARDFEDAIGIVRFIAELFKRKTFPLGKATFVMTSLYESSQKHESKSIPILIEFLEPCIMNLVGAGILSLDVYVFLLQHEKKLTHSILIREKLSKIIAEANAKMKSKFGAMSESLSSVPFETSTAPKELLDELQTIVNKMTIHNQQETLNQLDLLRFTNVNSVKKICHLLAHKALLNPKLCSTIRMLCDELNERSQASIRRFHFLEEVRKIINLEFQTTFKVQPNETPSDQIMNIALCAAQMAPRKVTKGSTSIIEAEVNAILNCAYKDKTLLPVLLEFIRIVIPEHCDDLQSSCKALETFLNAELNKNHSEPIILSISSVLKLIKDTPNIKKKQSNGSLSIENILQNLTQENAESVKQELAEINDIELLKSCSEIVLNKAIQHPEMITTCTYIMRRLVGKSDSDRKNAIQLPCENAFDELFMNSKITVPKDQAVNLMSYIGEWFRISMYKSSLAFKILRTLFLASRINDENVHLMIVFLSKSAQRFVPFKSFPLEIFLFLVQQQEKNEKLTEETHLKLEKILILLQNNSAPQPQALLRNDDALMEIFKPILEGACALDVTFISKLKYLKLLTDDSAVTELFKELLMRGLAEPEMAQTVATVCSTILMILEPNTSAKKFKDFIGALVHKTFQSILTTTTSSSYAVNVANLVCHLQLVLVYEHVDSDIKKLLTHSNDQNGSFIVPMLITFLKFRGKQVSKKLRNRILIQLKQRLRLMAVSEVMSAEVEKTIKFMENPETALSKDLLTAFEWVTIVNLSSDATADKDQRLPLELPKKSSNSFNQFTRLETIIRDLQNLDIEEVKSEAAKIENEHRDEIETFANTFFEIAVRSDEQAFYVKLAQIIQDEMKSNDFKDLLINRAMTNFDAKFEERDLLVCSSILTVVGEMFNIGWFRHKPLVRCLKELASEGFESDFTLELFYVLIKVVVIKLSEFSQDSKFLGINQKLRHKMKSTKNVRINLIANEVLEHLARVSKF